MKQDEIFLDITDYDRTCAADEDCVLVSEAVCYDCYDSAIRSSEQERFTADRLSKMDKCQSDVQELSCGQFLAICDGALCGARARF